MNEKIQAKAISVYDIQQKIFWFLVVALVTTSVLYMFIVSKTILSVVHRNVAEERIKDLNSEISDIESQYISLGQNINLPYAASLGFHDIAKIDYVSRTSALTMRDNAR